MQGLGTEITVTTIHPLGVECDEMPIFENNECTK